MLTGPLIGIDLRIVIWMVGWFSSAFLILLVFLMPAMAPELMLAGGAVVGTFVVIVIASFMPWNRKSTSATTLQ